MLGAAGAVKFTLSLNEVIQQLRHDKTLIKSPRVISGISLLNSLMLCELENFACCWLPRKYPIHEPSSRPRNHSKKFFQYSNQRILLNYHVSLYRKLRQSTLAVCLCKLKRSQLQTDTKTNLITQTYDFNLHDTCVNFLI